MKRKTFFVLAAVVLMIVPGLVFAQENGGESGSPLKTDSPEPASAAVSAAEQRLKIIRYGTDTEITNLIKTLQNEQHDGEKEDPLDSELLAAAEKTKNRSILVGVFNYFGNREKPGLEERAVLALRDRDHESAETVNAAIAYLGKLRSAAGTELLRDILDGEETRFLPAAIGALGKTAGGKETETAGYLIDYYTEREPGEENKRLLAAAVGDTGAEAGTDFLVSIAENEDERATLRMTALEGLAKIRSPRGLPAIITAAASRDPNVRAAAIGALGPFEGKEADEALIEAFRDSYYRTRIAAAKAAAERRLVSAVPFLRFRSENDEVPAVRDEAVKALGAIGGDEAGEILEELFKERKNSDRIRINAAEMLVASASRDYVPSVISELNEAKTKNQMSLYNGFLKALGKARSDALEELAGRFFAGGGVVEKSYALDFCSNNGFKSLAGEVQKLADPKNGSLSRKSLALLEKWGIPVKEASAETPESPDRASGPSRPGETPREPLPTGAVDSE